MRHYIAIDETTGVIYEFDTERGYKYAKRVLSRIRREQPEELGNAKWMPREKREHFLAWQAQH